MGFSFHATSCVIRAKESWNESHTINGSAPTAKTKEKPAGVNLISGCRNRWPSYLRIECVRVFELPKGPTNPSRIG
jgi:hypothetical protein